MPSREPLSEDLDADGLSLTQAEQAVAVAEARARAAREHARQLSHQAAALAGDPQSAGTSDDAKTESTTTDDRAAAARRRLRLRPRWLRRPGRTGLAAMAAAVVGCGSLGASGYLVWHHRTVAHQQQRAAEFAAAARQGAITLMSIDATKAREDVQRIIDSTTGAFKGGMLIAADDLVQSVEQSRVSTKATVQGVAVQSMTDDSAVVLVAARAEVANPEANPGPNSGKETLAPRSWRIVMTLQRDGGQLKVAKVEALP
ncbi:hypothetical protein PJK45_05800 [Mycobacterium kansasii]|nr:hypothetical protein [Mycobacterium kansasii]ARG59651.1 hypothetical protein B1T43_19415 [Mycobacterium kansasii]ARG65116.1 hypothetical protein B1T45_19820 [Mycobacterium kansasii]ARG72871.1 hypothetical protein B1T47_19150 [Mycobacterium kansasii]ARG78116.1 hypothetical protein B1T51_09175 [Mycobacterium kansasii]ARG83575.1 hypothetical protein B1T52_09375 [Mycobacterium kansasii]